MNTRERVERQTGTLFTDEQWAALDREVRQVELGENSLEKMAAQVQRYRQVLEPGGFPKETVRFMTGTPQNRQEAVSCLYAIRANGEDTVKSFREEVPNRMPLNAIPAWMQSRAERDGPPGRWASGVTLAADATVERADGGVSLSAAGQRAERAERRVAWYPDGEQEECIEVAANGVLDRLRRAGESLAWRYAWTPAQATGFLLSDATPLVAEIKSSTVRSYRASRNRILLEVDPAIAPRELSEAYAEIRGTARQRDLTVKHLRLAVFGAQRPEAGMSEWNREFRDWQYTSLRLFKRDMQLATKRILGE